MTTSITRFLAHDHASLLVWLARARSDPARFDASAYEVFRSGLLRHLTLEERVLLPAMQRMAVGNLDRLLAPVHIEHAAIELLLAPTPDVALVDELAALLVAHERMEAADDGIYTLADTLLAGHAEAIIALMREHPSHVAPPHHDAPGAPRTASAALAAVIAARAAA